MKGLILFIVAKLIIAIFYPFGIVYSVIVSFIKDWYYDGIVKAWNNLDEYLLKCAISDDQHANTYLAKFFNDTLIKQGGHKFGNPDETISSVIGKNIMLGKLSKTGKGLNNNLDQLEKDHSIKSIDP